MKVVHVLENKKEKLTAMSKQQKPSTESVVQVRVFLNPFSACQRPSAGLTTLSFDVCDSEMFSFIGTERKKPTTTQQQI